MDTVPVPGPATAPGDGDGDATREQLEADAEATRAITALLLDLAATAYRSVVDRVASNARDSRSLMPALVSHSLFLNPIK